jgi:adenylate cyclase
LVDEDDREWGKALANFALGRKADSDAALMNLETRFAETDAYNIAGVHAYRGEIDDTFRWLDRAYRQHDPNLDFIKTDRDFGKLRGDPRYKTFLRKMNLPE